jgi:8-oxo-dGTP pyrophosphatase MutT (NUDIX family)
MKIDPKLDKIIDALYRVSAKALIVNDGKILVTQEVEKWWGFPGGGIDHGEKVSTALPRELNEEIGIPVEDIKSSWDVEFISIGAVVDNIPRLNLFYKVQIPQGKVKKSTDVLDYKWVNSSELSKLWLSPSIESSLDNIIDIM